MKLFLIISILIFNFLDANNDRALYIKKYGNESKVALVIGNSSYSGKLAELKNPVNDAYDVKEALENLGFEVIYALDANQAKIDEKLREFTIKLESKKGVGLFYFAGHGLEIDKKNYIIPIGANVSDKYKIKYQTVSVNEIVDRMQNSGTRLNMLVLDACRNDPFHRGGGGLASMSNAKGTLIAYATSAGSVAQDNPSQRNGLYTKYFLKLLKSESYNQRDFFHKVRTGVYNESQGDQLPYLNDGTIGDFYFKVKDGSFNNEESSFNFKTINKDYFALTITTTPSDATVQIMNIKPKYYDGINLKKGEYIVKISKDGYKTIQGTIELKNTTTTHVTLQKDSVVYTPPKTYQSSNIDNNLVWQDPDTNLIWQKNIENKKYVWSDAIEYCKDLNYAGYSDWRLPNIDELMSLGNIKLLIKSSYYDWEKWYEKNKSKRNKNSRGDKFFIKKELVETILDEYGYFWSLTEYNSSYAWRVYFGSGYDYGDNKSNKRYVRCVRAR